MKIFSIAEIGSNWEGSLTIGKNIIKQCKNFKSNNTDEKNKIEENFRELRKITYTLDLNTWSKTKYQIFFFGIGIIFFVISELIK